jgi:hypothetical protein
MLAGVGPAAGAAGDPRRGRIYVDSLGLVAAGSEGRPGEVGVVRRRDDHPVAGPPWPEWVWAALVGELGTAGSEAANECAAAQGYDFLQVTEVGCCPGQLHGAGMRIVRLRA